MKLKSLDFFKIQNGEKIVNFQKGLTIDENYNLTVVKMQAQTKLQSSVTRIKDWKDIKTSPFFPTRLEIGKNWHEIAEEGNNMIFGLRTQPSDLNFKLFFPWNLINFSDLVVWASFTRMVAYLYDTPPTIQFRATFLMAGWNETLLRQQLTACLLLIHK